MNKNPWAILNVVSFDDLTHFELAGEIEGVKLYTAVVNSAHFKRDLRIVYLISQVDDKVKIALLFSTDLSLDATQIYKYYKARFQIEFLFRDVKQFTGLADCQTRCAQDFFHKSWHDWFKFISKDILPFLVPTGHVGMQSRCGASRIDSTWHVVKGFPRWTRLP